jgi:hypothetical protein
VTTQRLISQGEAVDWARAFAFGHCRLEPYVPSEPVDDHNATEYFFFRIAGLRFEVAGHLIIAVRRTDGQISQCGVTRHRMGRPFVAG